MAPMVSVAVMTKLKVPLFVGCPEIPPVAPFRANPVGSEPELTVKVSVPVPPEAATDWL